MFANFKIHQNDNTIFELFPKSFGEVQKFLLHSAQSQSISTSFPKIDAIKSIDISMSCGWLWGQAILMLEVEGLGVSYFDLRSANVLSMFTSATVFSSVISLCLHKSTAVSSRAPTGRTVSWWPSIFYSSPSFSECNDAEPSSTNLLTCWRESPHQNVIDFSVFSWTWALVAVATLDISF